MVTDGLGGWVVIQRNKNDSLLNLNRNWVNYENGLGDPNTDRILVWLRKNALFNTKRPMGDESGLPTLYHKLVLPPLC